LRKRGIDVQSIFGLPISQPILYVAAFAIILLLLAIFAWVLRRIVAGGAQGEGLARGRQPRLGIVDTFAIDRQRQLVIIRRDSVEHLLLLGGTTDVVIESNLVRTQPTSQQREQLSAPKASVLPEASRNSRPNNAMAELSFAPELREAPVGVPATPTAPVQYPPMQAMPKVSPIPRPSDLSEIANRFQNSGANTPATEREEPALSLATPSPAAPRQLHPTPITAHRDQDVPTNHASESEPEPVFPAATRTLTTSSAMPEARDIGSLNDTLRQLLGRTREP